MASTGRGGGETWGGGVVASVSRAPAPCRFVALPRAEVLGVAVPVANTVRSRLLGLSFIGRERVGTGLLIPGCHSIHTFGMRFALVVVFLDGSGAEIRRQRVGPRRVACEPRAAAVLELPAVR